MYSHYTCVHGEFIDGVYTIGMGKIILIGGAPAVGKSYLAQQLSLKLGIPWISTSDVNSLMARPKEEGEAVVEFDSEGQTPQQLLRKLTPQENLEQQNRENEGVWKDVFSFIKLNDLWDSYIIEGVAVLPHLIARDLGKRSDIHPLFLLDKDEARLRNVVKMKPVWEYSRGYAGRAKKLDLEYVLLFNSWLREQLKKYPFPSIELSEETMSLAAVLKIIK